ncbi:hypothetical protein KC19_1G054600 [Ceratodon purpureus]|uniref:Uncharacterized protein n=1 Tax=Ceratodon purpureus TaxID=3225 RepID=A0A8T0J474_CERPU|nr:hypothetical protein KC19_1G054600 [Ceratodon purpureus]
MKFIGGKRDQMQWRRRESKGTQIIGKWPTCGCLKFYMTELHLRAGKSGHVREQSFGRERPSQKSFRKGAGG